MFLSLAFVAGVIRGYSGFGFAMILALGLLTRLPPVQVVPVVLMLDLVCSASLWPSALKTFHPAIGGRLLAGMLLAVPLGTLTLARVPERWMAPSVAALCLIGGLLVLLRPPQWVATREPRTGLAFPAGLVSGLATSMASAGGPPVMVYLLRSGLAAARLRGTAIVFFALNSACSLVLLWLLGALGQEQLQMAIALLLPALFGSLAGQYLYHRKPRSTRVFTGVLLVLLSAWILAGSLGKLAG